MKKTVEEVLNEQVIDRQLVNANTLFVQTLEEDYTRIIVYHVLDSNDINSIYLKGIRIFGFPIKEKEKYDIEINPTCIAIFEVSKDGSKVDRSLLKLYDVINQELVDSSKESHYEILTTPKQKIIAKTK